MDSECCISHGVSLERMPAIISGRMNARFHSPQARDTQDTDANNTQYSAVALFATRTIVVVGFIVALAWCWLGVGVCDR